VRSPGLAILCELSEKNYRPASLDITQVFDWLEQRGFGMWEIPDHAEIPRKLMSAQDRRAANNFLFLRPGSPKERLVPQKAAEYEGAVEAP